jgi:hypothetical protein
LFTPTAVVRGAGGGRARLPGRRGPASGCFRSLSAHRPPGLVAEKGSVHCCVPMMTVAARGADSQLSHQGPRASCCWVAARLIEAKARPSQLRRTLDKARARDRKTPGEGEGAADTPPNREDAMRAASLALSIVCYVLLRSSDCCGQLLAQLLARSPIPVDCTCCG